MEGIVIIALIIFIIYLINTRNSGTSHQPEQNLGYPNARLNALIRRENDAKDMMRKVFFNAILKTHEENPMGGTPLEGYPILETLNNVHKFFTDRIPSLSIEYNLSTEKIRQLIQETFREIHDKVFIKQEK